MCILIIHTPNVLALIAHCMLYCPVRVPIPRLDLRQKLSDDHTQAVYVALWRMLVALQHLWSKVGHAALHVFPMHFSCVYWVTLGATKIDDVRTETFIYEDILRSEIAVADAARMKVFKRICNVINNLKEIWKQQLAPRRAAVQDCPQVRRKQVLERAADKFLSMQRVQ